MDTQVQTNQGDMHYEDQMVIKEIDDAVPYIRELKLAMIHYRSCYHKKHPMNWLLSAILSKDVEPV
jgi:hypothetical protein